MVRTIVVGVGNPILGDDGIGILVAKELRKKLKGSDVVVEEAYTGGLNLLDIICGYDRAILVDAISLPDKKIGEVLLLDPKEIPSAHSTNPHNVSLKEALDIAARIKDWVIPERIDLIGINIKPSLDFSDKISPEVKEAIPKAIKMVEKILS
jgi:hydrogenase maturation protease